MQLTQHHSPFLGERSPSFSVNWRLGGGWVARQVSRASFYPIHSSLTPHRPTVGYARRSLFRLCATVSALDLPRSCLVTVYVVAGSRRIRAAEFRLWRSRLGRGRRCSR